MKKQPSYLFWIVLVFGILSLLKFLGQILTSIFSDNLFYLHDIGNYLWMIPMLPFNQITYVIGAFIGILVFLFLLYKKVEFKISVIPLVYSLLPALTYILLLIGNSPSILSENILIMVYNLAIVAYSVYVLIKLKK